MSKDDITTHENRTVGKAERQSRPTLWLAEGLILRENEDDDRYTLAA